jgi:hypothetical protein
MSAGDVTLLPGDNWIFSADGSDLAREERAGWVAARAFGVDFAGFGALTRFGAAGNDSLGTG